MNARHRLGSVGRRALCALAACVVGLGGAVVSAALPAHAVNTCGGLPVTIQGTAASETLNGTAGNDVIDSGGGNDVINGMGGNDIICAGTGNDTIDGGTGVDTVSFEKTTAVNANLTTGTATGPGHDTIANVENLTGSPGSDTLTGNAGNNTIIGGLGNDTMNGAGGVDTAAFPGTVAVNANLTTGTATGQGTDTLTNFENLTGSSGSDTLTGNAGNNTIIGGLGNDTMNGAGGTDTAAFPGTVAVNANLTTGTATGQGSDTLTNFENLTGSSGNDTLTGNAGNNTINGGLGNDTMNGEGGVDTADFTGTAAVNANLTTGTATGQGSDTLANFENLTGSSGNDTLTGNAGNNTIIGGLGNDTMNGAGGVDTAAFPGTVGVNANLTSGTATGDGSDTLANFENLTGSSGNDLLTGNAANNTLDGSAGTDLCSGGAGSDHSIDCEINGGSINPAGAIDTYSFTFVANQKLYLQSLAYNATHGDLAWTLTGPGGNVFGPQIADSDVDTFTITTPGAYTLKVNGNAAGDTGTNSFRMWTVVDQTAPMTLGTAKTVTLTTPGQTSALTFSGTANQLISLDLTNSTIDGSAIEFVRPDGSILNEYGFGSSSEQFIDPTQLDATGTWTLLIDPNGADTGSVTVLARVVTNQTGPITLGTAKTVTITQPGQTDALTFSGTANQLISLDLTNSTIDGSAIEFVRPDGDILNEYGFGSSSEQFIDPTQLDATGTWTLLIDPNGADTGSVTVLAKVVTNQTGPITLGTAKTVTITQPGQTSALTFSGTLNQRISLDLTNSTIDGSAIEFVQPDGDILNEYGFGSGSEQFIDPTQLDATGTWTLLIDPNGADTGSVTVLAKAVTDVTGTITLGTAKAASITQAGQRARYTFHGTSGQNIAISITGSTISGSALNFYRPDGSILTEFGFGTGSSTDSTTLDATGTWTVEVDPVGEGTGSLNLKLS